MKKISSAQRHTRPQSHPGLRYLLFKPSELAGALNPDIGRESDFFRFVFPRP
jgi:hypothetical protein